MNTIQLLGGYYFPGSLFRGVWLTTRMQTRLLQAVQLKHREVAILSTFCFVSLSAWILFGHCCWMALLISHMQPTLLQLHCGASFLSRSSPGLLACLHWPTKLSPPPPPTHGPCPPRFPLSPRLLATCLLDCSGNLLPETTRLMKSRNSFTWSD